VPTVAAPGTAATVGATAGANAATGGTSPGEATVSVVPIVASGAVATTEVSSAGELGKWERGSTMSVGARAEGVAKREGDFMGGEDARELGRINRNL